MNKIKRLFLFNPVNLSKIETSYKELMEQTGRGKATLSGYKTKRQKVRLFNSFLVDEKTPIKVLREMAATFMPVDEVWKKVPGFPNTVSSYGRIKSEKTNDFMIPYINRAGYMAIRLKRAGKCFTIALHRLIAMVFLAKDEEERIYYFKFKDSDEHLFSGEKEYVAHLNRKIFDNRACNLVWCNSKELHRIRKSKTISVLKLDKETEKPLDFYFSIEQAGVENNISPTAIGQCLSGKTKTSAGFKWRIDTGEDIEFEDIDYGGLTAYV